MLEDLEFLTPEEARRVIAAAGNSTEDKDLGRTWACLFTVLWETGIRISEALALTPAVIQHDRILLTRRKKKIGTGQDYMPIRLATFNQLSRHITVAKLTANKRLFPWTTQGVNWRLKEIGRGLGIPKLHAHMFRHGFAMNYIAQAPGEQPAMITLAEIQRLLGHKSVAATSVYTRPRMDTLAERLRGLKF